MFASLRSNIISFLCSKDFWLGWRKYLCLEEGKEGTNPRMPNHYGSADSLRWAPNDCGGAEKSQIYRKYFLQYSIFAFERPQVWKWGRQTCFLPGRHLTSLRSWSGEGVRTGAKLPPSMCVKKPWFQDKQWGFLAHLAHWTRTFE